jgi:hypothetical protein
MTNIKLNIVLLLLKENYLSSLVKVVLITCVNNPLLTGTN